MVVYFVFAEYKIEIIWVTDKWARMVFKNTDGQEDFVKNKLMITLELRFFLHFTVFR